MLRMRDAPPPRYVRGGVRDEAKKMKDAYRLDMQGVDTSYTERVKEKARATKVVGYYITTTFGDRHGQGTAHAVHNDR